MNSIAKLTVFTLLIMAIQGDDWKVKITNNAQVDIVVKAAENSHKCWHLEDFEHEQLILKDHSHIFYIQPSNSLMILPPPVCFGNADKYMVIQIKEHLDWRAEPHGYVSKLKLQRTHYEAPEGTACNRGGQLQNRCNKFKQVDPIQVQPIGEWCNDYYAKQKEGDRYKNLNIQIFKGKLGGDKSSDNCYNAVEVVVTNYV